MNREEILYLTPYLSSFAATFGVFLYAWRHRRVRGARAYVLFVGGQALTILGFIFELISPDLQIKILWDKFQWVTDSFLVILPFLVFSFQFSEYKLRNPVLTWGFLVAFLFTFTALLLTDNLHHLIYPNPHLSTDVPFPELKYDFTYIVYIYSLVYVFGANIYGIGLLLKRAFQSHDIYRLQFLTVAGGFLIPVLFTLFSLAGIKIAPPRDLTPFTLAIGNLIVAWGFFRYRLFDLVPIAHEQIIEKMGNSVIVLDAANRIVDINQTARTNLEIKSSNPRGLAANYIFARWPIVIDMLETPDALHREMAVPENDDFLFFDINISPIYNNQQNLIGRIVTAHDITRQKTLESAYRILSEELEKRVQERTEELRQETEQYRALFEQTNDAIFILDLKGRHLDANQRAADMLGYAHDEIIGLSFRETSIEMDKSEQVLERILKGEHIPLYERILRKKNGELIPVEINVELVRDIHGNPLHIQSVVRDITERKQAEEALRHSAERYRTVVENQTEFIVRWKPGGVRTFINEAYCRYFGITAEEALKSGFMSLVAEEDRRAVEAKVSRLSSGKVDSETETHRVIKPDGSIGWQEWTDHAIRNEHGQVVEIQSVGRDITEKVQADEAIRESEERFAILSTATFEAIGLSDEGKVIDANEQMLQLFGYTRDEMIGMDVGKLIAPESQETVKDHATSDSNEAYEHLSIKKDGTIFPVEVRPRAIPYRGRVVRATAIRDITERRKAIIALEKSENKHRLLFEAANDSIFLMKDGLFIDCNSKTLEMFGCQREEIIGKSPVDFSPTFQPDGKTSQVKAAEKINATLNGASQSFEWKHCRLDRTLFDAEVSLNLLELDDESLIQAIVRDISERKHAEENLIETYNTTLEGWAKALELRDKETEGHSRRVTETTLIVARAMGILEDEVEHIRRGAILHDIGKMGIPDQILKKEGPLSTEERRIINEHPRTAFELLKPIMFLDKALDIPFSHHEKWDGSGYPRGLKREEIPLPARIFAVVDVWDALSSDRPYRKAWEKNRVVEYIKKEVGRHFDPQVVNVFLKLVDEGRI